MASAKPVHSSEDKPAPKKPTSNKVKEVEIMPAHPEPGTTVKLPNGTIIKQN